MAGRSRSQLVLAAAALLVLVVAVVAVGLRTRDPAWTAGAAALATMIVIAYQSWQIRQSTAVAARSVSISQAVAIEAEKARLDQRAPKVRVVVGQPEWPPTRPRVHLGQQENSSFDMGQIFRLPGAGNQRIGLFVKGVVVNEGPSIANIEFRGLRVSEAEGARGVPKADKEFSEPGIRRQPISAGFHVNFLLQDERTVAEWAENFRAAGQGQKPPHAIAGQVVVDDGFDNGVVDTWTIEATGTPLRPVPEETESWRFPRLEAGAPIAPGSSTIVSEVPIKASVQPQQRMYWRSKEQGIELPSPELWEQRSVSSRTPASRFQAALEFIQEVAAAAAAAAAGIGRKT